MNFHLQDKVGLNQEITSKVWMNITLVYLATSHHTFLVNTASEVLSFLHMDEIIHNSFSRVSHHEPLLTLIKTNEKECLLVFHNVFCLINLINCIVQNKWAE